jgi:hypothetical protein
MNNCSVLSMDFSYRTMDRFVASWNWEIAAGLHAWGSSLLIGSNEQPNALSLPGTSTSCYRIPPKERSMYLRDGYIH